MMYRIISVILVTLSVLTPGRAEESCSDVSAEAFKKIIQDLEEGVNAKVLILQGTEEIAIRPYFVAMGALKAGAEQVHVFTPEEVPAKILQSYSPDYSVYPYYGREELPMMEYAISKVDVVVLGPGPTGVDGFLVRDVIGLCKDMKKPLIVNAGAVIDVALNISILKDYPAPGAILIPDPIELEDLVRAIGKRDFGIWGENVDVLVRGRGDEYYSKGALKWSIEKDGVQKRKEEQTDILAGFLGSFYSWALQPKPCSPQYARAVAANAATRLVRAASQRAREIYGRSMIPTDILKVAHEAFKSLFG